MRKLRAPIVPAVRSLGAGLLWLMAAGCGPGSGADRCASMTCPPTDGCHGPGTCDPATGACSNPTLADGTSCQDADLCTQKSSCNGGVCVGSDPITCMPIDQCHVAIPCMPAVGCIPQIADDGIPCEDGNPCTTDDTCVQGGCAAGTQKVCTTASACHMPGQCSPVDGSCIDGNALKDGTACDCGSCIGGACGASTVGSTATPMGSSLPVAMMIAGATVYFTNSSSRMADKGSIGALGKAGGMAMPVIAGLTDPVGLAVDAKYVYWNDGAGLHRAPLPAGMAELLAPSNGGTFYGLALDQTNLYFTDSSRGKVLSLPLGGGMPSVVATDETSPAMVVTDGANVYWWNDGDKSIRQAPVGGGKVLSLATGQQKPSGIAVDSKNVYWVDRTAGTVLQTAIGGGDVKTLATGQPEPVALTVTATALYWANNGAGKAGTISKLDLAGGMPQVIPGSRELVPVAITHDDKCIYWVNAGTNELRKAGF